MSGKGVEALKGSSVEGAPASTLQPFNPSTLEFINHQRTKRLDLARLRRVADAVLTELNIHHWNLSFYFVGVKRMAGINEQHLGHAGPTDVITFDYNDPDTPGCIAGEIFICVEVAVVQAREFRTTWQSEVARYMIHSLLHLCGHDDLKPAARRKMKQVENRLLGKLTRQFKLSGLGA